MHIKWTIAKAIMLHLDILFNLQTTILIATLPARTGKKKKQIKEKVKERSQHQMHYYTLTRKCFIP